MSNPTKPIRISRGRCLSSPFDEQLLEGETLLWVGRPNEKIYRQGSRTWSGAIKFCAWGFPLVVGMIIDVIFNLRYGSVISGMLTCVPIFLGMAVVAAFMYFCKPKYERADWYAFSDHRLFLVSEDDEEPVFVIYQTSLRNIKEVAVKIQRNASPAESTGQIGTLSCIFHKAIPLRVNKKFIFKTIDCPLQVKMLLLDALESPLLD